MKKIIRLRIDLKLKKNGQTVLSTKRFLKTRIVAVVQELLTSEWTMGTVRVWYNVEQDYWNQANFTTLSELKTALSDFTEEQLVKDFV